MQLGGIQGNLSTLKNALSISHHFQLTPQAAQQLIDHQLDIIQSNWQGLCEQAGLANIESKRLWQGAVLNPFCFT
jgi:serine/threonine-protein kinase HipA